jgi:diphosphomevalonate decarboxylase
MSRTIVARAPSNIAIVKYMGKSDTAENLPANSSLSMTLDKLCTWVELECTGSEGIRWDSRAPLEAPEGAQVPILGDDGIARVVRHLERVRSAAPQILQRYGLRVRTPQGWLLRSCNTFPPSSGIASSASSFAAMSLAATAAMADDGDQFASAFSKSFDLKRDLASLSRRGSGSSCRSFEGPWVLWAQEAAAGVTTRMPKMAHFVVVVSAEPKAVSSSEAHRRVTASPLWDGRTGRAEERVKNLLSALGDGDLKVLSRIAWTEAWEMHSLFHTSPEPFTYWLPATLEILKALNPYVASQDPVVVTMDAGPNVHVSVQASSAEEWRRRLHSWFGAERVLMDHEGKGAELIRV